MSEAQAEAQNESALSNLFDNEDVSVDLSPPVFDKVVVKARLSKAAVVESGGKDGAPTGKAVALTWEFEAPAIDMNGREYQPGHSLNDRLNVKPPSSMNNRAQVQEIALRTLGRLAKKAGKLDLPPGVAPTAQQIVSAIEQAVGYTTTLKLNARTSDKRPGEVFQNIEYA